MSHSKPDNNTLQFQCDHCPATYTMHADEGSPVADVAKCLQELHSIGWKSEKPVGYAWENYCPKCAMLPKSERVPTSRD